MKTRLFLPFVLFLLAAQDSPPVAITSPASGEILRGEITIIGSTDIPNFASAQLDFKYASDDAALSQPALDSPLYLWNTASITDGDYILRLRVTLTDGTFQEVTVPITIQNDAPILTPTPAVTSTPASIGVQIPTAFLLAASPTPTEVPRPTPTPLPPNPASLTQSTILTSLGRGAIVIIGLFIFSFILLRLRQP
jgi:VCBS repeat-containing protein